MAQPFSLSLDVTIARKKAIDSIGKQRADPIDANFLSGIVIPLGRVALVDLHAKTSLRN